MNAFSSQDIDNESDCGSFSARAVPAVYPPADVDREAAAKQGCCGRGEAPRALVREVLPDSPADDAGCEPGCFVTTVDGRPVRDIIDWRWLTADDVIEVGYIDLDGDAGEVELERD